MSYCEKKGKDEIIVVTKEDHQKPISGKVAALSAALEKDDDDDEPGFLLPDGKLNWNCPCVGSMVAGPCGYYFREAFTCFHYSKEESKGSDCLDQFKAMHDCMSKYPTVYGGINREADEDEESVFDKLDSPPQNELSVQRATDPSPAEK